MTEYALYDPSGIGWTEAELEERYAEDLSECCGPVQIGTLEYDAAQVLREVDPIAYRVGYSDSVSYLIEDGWTEEPPAGAGEDGAP